MQARAFASQLRILPACKGRQHNNGSTYPALVIVVDYIDHQLASLLG